MSAVSTTKAGLDAGREPDELTSIGAAPAPRRARRERRAGRNDGTGAGTAASSITTGTNRGASAVVIGRRSCRRYVNNWLEQMPL